MTPLAYIVKGPDPEAPYWNNQQGWVERMNWATVFDKVGDIDLPIDGWWRDIPKMQAMQFAMSALYQDRDGDEYGWAMSWLYGIADTICWKRDIDVPSAWEFRPSPLGFCKDDEFKIEILDDLSDNQLLYAGNLLHRYVGFLKRAGKDY